MPKHTSRLAILHVALFRAWRWAVVGLRGWASGFTPRQRPDCRGIRRLPKRAENLLELVPELRGGPDLETTNEGVTTLWLKQAPSAMVRTAHGCARIR